MKINQIKPYEKNAKKHPDKQLDQVAASIREFGWQQPIVVDKNGVIIVGHGRYEAYNKHPDIGEPEIRVADLTEEQTKAYRLADNKLNESDWDMDLAVQELKELSAPMLELTGFDVDLTIEPEEKDDEVPEVPEEPKSKLGDLYELGGHRVLCGDSTKLEDVERLMDGKKADVVVTDPPYNTGMVGSEMKKTKQGDRVRLDHFFNDNIENWEEFLQDIFNNYFAYTKGDCAFYVFIDWRRVADIRNEIEKHMDVKNVIVWDKQVHGLGSDYKSTYELCVVGKKGKPEIQNRYGLDYQDIWRLQRTMGRNKDHATAKPVELCEKPIKHASKADDIVMDLFLGSGSTLIASEKTGRICYGLEMDEKYCDVIVQRYVDYVDNPVVYCNGKDETKLWQKAE